MPQRATATSVDQGENTFRIGLLGRGIAGSRTPRMHMAAAADLGIGYEYQLIDAQVRDLPEQARAILDLLQAEGLDGLNVTYPYKRAMMQEMDELSDAARAVGAVNTVLFRNGRRYGHNTDHWGFGESLRRGLPGVAMETVLLIGAGGAGGAVAHALLDAGVARLLVRDVSEQAAGALVQVLAARYGTDRVEAVTDLSAAAARADGIVNATPVGMEKHPGLPLPAEDLNPHHWVADIVYFPLETELLKEARKLGCKVLPGSGMALFQAVRAFALFTGQQPDEARMRDAFRSFDENGAGEGA